MRVIDLCCGLGGATQAFKDRGHDVFTVDIDPKFEPDLCADVRHVLPGDLPTGPLLVWASPPCQGFSVAAIGCHWKNHEPDHVAREGMEIIGGCLRLIHALNPRYWILENPRGMMRRVLGPPTITTYYAAWGLPYLKPTDLWGVIPKMEWPKPRRWQGAPRGAKSGVQGVSAEPAYVHSPRNSNRGVRDSAQLVVPRRAGCGKDGLKDLRPKAAELRALVPYELSLALCLAIESELPFKFNRPDSSSEALSC